MKKLIAILAIMMVIVGAVFADPTPTPESGNSETHKLHVKSNVLEVVPAFQLWFGDGTVATVEKTNATPNDFVNGGSYDPYANAALYVGFTLDEGGDVTVVAVLANKAKINKAFDLAFSDGTFSVNRNGQPETFGPTSITTTAGGVITGTSSIAKVKEANAEAAAADAAVRVTFNGTTVTATNPVLATAIYSYTGDPTIDPNATGEYYYADIVLTVTAV